MNPLRQPAQVSLLRSGKMQNVLLLSELLYGKTQGIKGIYSYGWKHLSRVTTIDRKEP